MDPLATTRSGTLRGWVQDGVLVFRGVRFAEPPFGANRLQPPRPVDRWNGVRDARAFGPKSLQAAYPPGIAEALAERAGQGEDCLTLNVWTPTLEAARRPVMVWIPGGMFEFHGASVSDFYDGGRFARDGVVCATIAYRVGAEGFLYLDDGIANLGLLDQIAALEWVRDNIAAFGGDPGNVTIFGQSAGAMSVAALLASPRARGLFRRAIVQSGTGESVNSPATARRVGERLAERIGVAPTREAIAAVAPERVLEAQARLREDLLVRPDPTFWGEVALSGLPWAPTVDGQVLRQRPIDAVREGAARDIDLLIGTTTEETRLFLLAGGAMDRITESDVSMMATAYGLSAEDLDAYRAMHPSASAGELFSAIQTDAYWRIPALRFADAHADTAMAATYVYEFAWRSPQLGGRLGAAHATDIAFVFDTLGLGTAAMLGDNPPQTLADTMHKTWVSFASRGECDWPRYDAAHRRTMRFDTISRVVDDPLGAVLPLWSSAR